MSGQAKFFLDIVLSNYIMVIMMVDSTASSKTNTNTMMSLLSGHDISGSHVIVCCQKVFIILLY